MNRPRFAGSSDLRERLAAAAGVTLILATATAATLGLRPSGLADAPALPDLLAVEDPQARKAHFIAYLHPIIIQANDEIARQRKRLLAIDRGYQVHGGIALMDRWWLAERAADYSIDAAQPEEQLERLLRRQDTVPPSLALAQAAIESGWGTSRFAVEANNLFGHWCYVRGCGIVPTRRAAGARHEVATFDSPLVAVRRYLHNLNTHDAYAPLRTLRARARAEQRDPSGHRLASGLTAYSERGEPYVRQLRTVMRVNALEQYDATD